MLQRVERPPLSPCTEKRSRVDLFAQLNPEHLARCFDFLCDAPAILAVVACSRVFAQACAFTSHVRLQRAHIAAGFVWRRFSRASHVELVLPCASLELLAGYFSSPLLDRVRCLEIFLDDDELYYKLGAPEDGAFLSEAEADEILRDRASFCRALRGLARTVARGALPAIEELSLACHEDFCALSANLLNQNSEVVRALREFVRALPADVALRMALHMNFGSPPLVVVEEPQPIVQLVNGHLFQPPPNLVPAPADAPAWDPLFDELLARDGVDLNRVTEHMGCALRCAVTSLCPWDGAGAIERLVALGADPNAEWRARRAQCGPMASSPLSLAARSGCVAAVRALLAAGAHVEDGARLSPIAPPVLHGLGMMWSADDAYTHKIGALNFTTRVMLGLWRPRSVDGETELIELPATELRSELLRYYGAVLDEFIHHGADMTRRYAGTTVLSLLRKLLDPHELEGAVTELRQRIVGPEEVDDHEFDDDIEDEELTDVVVRTQLAAMARSALEATRALRDDPDRRALQRLLRTINSLR